MSNELDLDTASLLAEADKLIATIKAEHIDYSTTPVGQLVTKWFDYKTESDKLKDARSKILEYQETIEMQIVEKMHQEDMDSISTSKGSFTLKTKSMPSIEDLYSFVKWVSEDLDNRIGFIQKKVNESAVNELLEEQGILPPGVKTYMKDQLNKRKK